MVSQSIVEPHKRAFPLTTLSLTGSHFVAGLGSGLVSSIILQPIDLLKTRTQQSGHGSIVAIFREVTRSSTLDLWRGTVPSALRTGFGSAIYFTSLNSIRQHASRLMQARTGSAGGGRSDPSYSSSLPRLPVALNLASGAVARAFAGMVLMPLTVIKVRYESNLYSYRSLGGAARDIARAEGLRGFFTGFGATALRDAPYAGLYVVFYEGFKSRLSATVGSRRGSGEGSAATRFAGNPTTTAVAAPSTMPVSTAAAINFGSGLMAATLCTVISNPFDAVKTRIQLQPAVYRNMYQTGVKMVAEEGLRSLWGGLTLRLSRKALSSALAWTLYEELIKNFTNWRGGGKEDVFPTR
jgi:solute carrier family 25, member 38